MRVINKISDDLIEIREYAKPNACFQTNEYPDNYDFVVLKKIINPFDLFNDNKTKDKEIERLTELCNKYEEEHKTTFETWQKDIKKIERLHQCIKDDKENANEIISEQAKEIEELKDENEKLTKEWLKSQEKRRKAIEYLEQPFRDNFDFSKATLLEILRGGKE